VHNDIDRLIEGKAVEKTHRACFRALDESSWIFECRMVGQLDRATHVTVMLG